MVYQHGFFLNFFINMVPRAKFHSYDILGAGMLWKPKKTRKFVKIRAEECFDKVLNEEF